MYERNVDEVGVVMALKKNKHTHFFFFGTSKSHQKKERMYSFNAASWIDSPASVRNEQENFQKQITGRNAPSVDVVDRLASHERHIQGPKSASKEHHSNYSSAASLKNNKKQSKKVRRRYAMIHHHDNKHSDSSSDEDSSDEDSSGEDENDPQIPTPKRKSYQKRWGPNDDRSTYPLNSRLSSRKAMQYDVNGDGYYNYPGIRKATSKNEHGIRDRNDPMPSAYMFSGYPDANGQFPYGNRMNSSQNVNSYVCSAGDLNCTDYAKNASGFEYLSNNSFVNRGGVSVPEQRKRVIRSEVHPETHIVKSNGSSSGVLPNSYDIYEGDEDDHDRLQTPWDARNIHSNNIDYDNDENAITKATTPIYNTRVNDVAVSGDLLPRGNGVRFAKNTQANIFKENDSWFPWNHLLLSLIIMYLIVLGLCVGKLMLDNYRGRISSQ